MADLLLHDLKHVHLGYIEDLMKALLMNGLKISSKKCQIFMTESEYISSTLLMREVVCTKPLKTRLETIQKLIPH